MTDKAHTYICTGPSTGRPMAAFLRPQFGYFVTFTSPLGITLVKTLSESEWT